MDSERTSRYRDLWFDDGNLVIQTGLALFRVHKGVLSVHASVFRDMTTLPTPANQDMFEGVPLAVFPDDANDMHHFLRALYFPDYFLPPPERTSFDILEGVLRLAHKYDVPTLRRRALKHLASACVTDVDKITDETNFDRSYSVGPSDIGSALKAEIALAREVQALWLLPILFLSMGLRKRDDYVGADVWMGKARSISPEDAVASLFAYKAAMGSQKMNAFLHQLCNYGECAREDTLINEDDIALARRMPITAFDKYLEWTSDLCAQCKSEIREEYRQEKERIWGLLPAAVGLPPWDELLEMKELDIG